VLPSSAVYSPDDSGDITANGVSSMRLLTWR
jgi:hypothetical protein